MRTVKWNPFLSSVSMLLGVVLLVSGPARAEITSTNPAAILVFPKIPVVFGPVGGVIADTVIQVTNTSVEPVNVRCFYINANGHCSGGPNIGQPCVPSQPPSSLTNPCALPDLCVPGWVETDFSFRLTPKQPIRWSVGQGLLALPLDPGGSIPPAPELPMYLGELKCVQVGDDESPVDRNDLKGEATIEYADQTNNLTNTAGYNAIGIRAIEGANNRDNTLVLGQEYNGCPNVLVLNHFFDNAIFPAPQTPDNITTLLTLVPCSQDFNLQVPQKVTVQCLVFNEFEQRFSTSRMIQCVETLVLSDIDTRPGFADDYTSIFNVAVQGTLVGQTVCRGVDNPATPAGEGILAVMEEAHTFPLTGFPTRRYTAAFNTHHRGVRAQFDFIEMPAASPAGP